MGVKTISESDHIGILGSILKEALKKVWGAPAVISILVIVTLIYLHLFATITKIISYTLIGLVYIGMILAFVLERDLLKKLGSKLEPDITVQRLLAHEIEHGIEAHLDEKYREVKLDELKANIYGELAGIFLVGEGLKAPYKQFVAGIGENIESLQQARERTSKFMGARIEE